MIAPFSASAHVRQALHPGEEVPFAPMTPTAIVAYLALFATVGFLFVLASLLVGEVVCAPTSPTAQKLETYECGEPAVGRARCSSTCGSTSWRWCS